MSICKRVSLAAAVGAVLLAMSVPTAVPVVRAQEAVATTTDAPKVDDSKPPEESPLPKEPTSPQELFEAAVLMVDLQRPNLARYYLRKLMDPPPEPATLVSLRDRNGVSGFLQLWEQKVLRPWSVDLLDQMNAAMANRFRDPQFLEQIVAKLSAGTAQRIVATEELRSFGPAAVGPLAAMWLKATEPAPRAAARDALRNLGQPALPALTAALDIPDPAWRVILLGILSDIGSRDALPYVWFFAADSNSPAEVREAASQAVAALANSSTGAKPLSVESVSRELREQAERHFRGGIPWDPDLFSGQIVLWHWDAENESLVSREVAPREASRQTALRFALQAITLSPDDRDSQRLYLTLVLSGEDRTKDAEVAGDLALPGGAKSLRGYVEEVGVPVLQDVLRQTLKHRRTTIAVRALRLLGDVATWDEIRPRGEAGSPLSDALADRDPRVQFEAADAILRLKPPAASSFPGSSRIVEILTRALSTDGTHRVIVADSSMTHAGFVGGLFAELGYEPVLTNFGRDVFRIASERGDIDLIVLHPNLTRWTLSDTVANLRADARTAGVPIVIPVSQLASAELDVAKQRLLLKARIEPLLKQDRYRSVAFLAESKTSTVLERVLTDFLALLPTKTLTPRERQARVVVGDPSSEHGAFVGRMFGSLGYEPLVSTTGADARLASDQPRVEIVVLNSAITDGTAAQTLARMRAEGQAAALPLIVLFQDVVSGDPYVLQQRLAELVLREGESTLLGEHAVVKLALSIRRIGVALTPNQISRLRDLARSPNDSDFHVGLLAVFESFDHVTTRVEELTPKFDSPAQKAAMPKNMGRWLGDPSAGVTLIAESQTASDVDRQVRSFVDRLLVRPLTPAERADHAQRAVKWLAHLATQPNARAFDIAPAEVALGRTLDGDSEQTRLGLDALADIGTSSSQQRIATLVLDARRPIDLRRQAASFLDRHVNRHGNLLSRSTIDALRLVWDEVGPE
jgi:DNA-binding response OmpR family regulator